MLSTINIKQIILIIIGFGFFNTFLFYSLPSGLWGQLGVILASIFLLGILCFIPAWIIWLFNMKKGLTFFNKTLLIFVVVFESLIILSKLF